MENHERNFPNLKQRVRNEEKCSDFLDLKDRLLQTKETFRAREESSPGQFRDNRVGPTTELSIAWITSAVSVRVTERAKDTTFDACSSERNLTYQSCRTRLLPK